MKKRDTFSYEGFIEAVERMRVERMRDAKRLEEVDRMIEAREKYHAERARSIETQPEFV